MFKQSNTLLNFGVSDKQSDRNQKACIKVLDGGRYLQLDILRLLTMLMEGVKVMELQSKTGTGHTKYYPVIDSEVMAFVKSNIIYRCITAMKEYENKSLEELRFEDYESERKGKQTIFQPVFNSVQNAGTDDPMLNTRMLNKWDIFREDFFRSTPFRTTTRGVLFGSASKATDGGYVSTNTNGEEPFGITTRGFNFGTTADTTITGGFNLGTAAATTAFGDFNFTNTSATSTAGGFGFGNKPTSTTAKSDSFGTTSTADTAGGFRTKYILKKATKDIFQSTKATTKTGGTFFESTPTTSIFESTPTTNTTVKDIFGLNQTASPTSGSIFASVATTSTAVKDIFGSNPAAKPAVGSVFGTISTTSTTIKDIFGSNQTASRTSGNVFGSAPTTSTFVKDAFGSNQTATSAVGSAFGSALIMSTADKDTFVSNQTASPTAGNDFESIPITKTNVKDIFGSNQTASSAAGSAFGSAPTMSTADKDTFVSNQTASPTAGSVFGSIPTTSTSVKDTIESNQNAKFTAEIVFNSAPTTSAAVKDIFGSNKTTSTNSGNVFGSAPTTSTFVKETFGSNETASSAAGSAFGSAPIMSTAEKDTFVSNQTASPTAGNDFGSIPTTITNVKDIFGSNQTASPTAGSVFGSIPKTSTAIKDTIESNQNANTTAEIVFKSAPTTSAVKDIFGSNKTASTNSGNVFGSAPTTSTFVKYTFGLNQTASPASGSVFESAPTMTTAIKDIFGSDQTASPAAESIFGSVVTSTAVKDTFVSNETASPTAESLFGSVSKTSTTIKDSFGSTQTAGTTLFPLGSNSIFKDYATMCQTFGSNTQLYLDTSGQTSTGTTPVKYKPIVCSDMVYRRGGTEYVQIKIQCITCMKEYECKSIEELRLEDYVAGRKPDGKIEDSQWPKTGSAPLLKGSNNLKDTEHIQPTKSSSRDEEPKEMNVCIQLKGDVAELSKRLATVSVNNEHFEAVLDKMSSKISMLNDQIKELLRDSQITVSSSELSMIKEQIHTQTQLLLRNVVEIAGIPETHNEKLLDIIYKISSKLGIDIQETDIDWVIRVTPDLLDDLINDPSSLIVVRFVRGLKKYELIEGRKATTLTLEDLNLGDSTQKVCVNEHLTQANRLLFHKARQLAKLPKYRHCWTENGCTYARQGEGTPAIQISSQILDASPEILATSIISTSTLPLDPVADKLVTSSDSKVEKLVSSSTSPSNPKVDKT